MHASVLNLRALIGEVDGLSYRLVELITAQAAGVGHHLLNQNAFLLVGDLSRHV
ncbi:MAG: hypothetical protein VX939_04890 [Pseudomonadota bacterium]|nr:hypothetical protein [Pseudomonadota bacterium]